MIMSICIKTMSGDDVFYEYVTSCACKLLSHVQGGGDRQEREAPELQMSAV